MERLSPDPKRRKLNDFQSIISEVLKDYITLVVPYNNIWNFRDKEGKKLNNDLYITGLYYLCSMDINRNILFTNVPREEVEKINYHVDIIYSGKNIYIPCACDKLNFKASKINIDPIVDVMFLQTHPRKQLMIKTLS